MITPHPHPAHHLFSATISTLRVAASIHSAKCETTATGPAQEIRTVSRSWAQLHHVPSPSHRPSAVHRTHETLKPPPVPHPSWSRTLTAPSKPSLSLTPRRESRIVLGKPPFPSVRCNLRPKYRPCAHCATSLPRLCCVLFCCAKAYTGCAALRWPHCTGFLSSCEQRRASPLPPPPPPPNPPLSLSPSQPKVLSLLPLLFFSIFHFSSSKNPSNPEPKYTFAHLIATTRSLAPTLSSRAPFSDTLCIENNFWLRPLSFNHSSFHDPHIDTNDQPYTVQSRRHTLKPTGARVRASERGETERDSTERDRDRSHSHTFHQQGRPAIFQSRTILNYRSVSTHLHANCDENRISHYLLSSAYH